MTPTAKYEPEQASFEEFRQFRFMATAEKYQRTYAQSCLRDLECAYRYPDAAKACSPGELERTIKDEDEGKLRKP